MGSDLRIVINEKAAQRVINQMPSLEPKLLEITERIAGNANSLSAGYRTPIFHDHKTGETKGDTQPHYSGEVYKGKVGPIGIVHPKNYAAMKDNYLHNTMLKARY